MDEEVRGKGEEGAPLRRAEVLLAVEPESNHGCELTLPPSSHHKRAPTDTNF